MKQEDSLKSMSLFALSWPIFIDILLHMGTLTINTAMITRAVTPMELTHTISATTVANQIFDIFIPIFNFIGIGCSVVVAQYLGAKKHEQARYVIHLAIAFNAIIGVLCYLFINLFGYKILIWMNTPESILNLSYGYFHILGICLMFEAIAIILASCLRVYGRSRVVMYVSLIMNIITILGNFLVLYGYFGLPKLGIIGVAWSIVLGRFMAVVLLFCLLIYSLGIRLEWKLFFQWRWDIFKKIFKIGLPSAGENLSWSGQTLVITSFVGILGTTALTAQNFYFQIAYFMMLFSISLSIGNEIIIGHLVGAKQFDQAYRRTLDSLKIGFCVTAVVVVGFYLLRYQILDIFNADHSVTNIMLPLFLLSIFLEPGRTLNLVMVNSLRASGDAVFPFMMALIFMWGVSIPVAYFLGIKMGMGLLGIWIGFACDEWLRGLANTWRWLSRRWEGKRLDIE